MTTRNLTWTGRELVEDLPRAEPVVIDSWLLADGEVAALPDHERRFRHACARRLPRFGDDELHRFLAAVRANSPESGFWFPRIEASESGLAARIRPAPARRRTTALWVPGVPDPRGAPTIKGPDLRVLAGLRAGAHQVGADDAVLCTADDQVLESAHAALLWWRGEELCLPEVTAPVLESVTVSLVLRIAAARGVRVRRDRLSLGEVDNIPVWMVNALHGVSPVSAWQFPDSTEVSGPLAPADEWNDAIRQFARPVHDHPTPGHRAHQQPVNAEPVNAPPAISDRAAQPEERP